MLALVGFFLSFASKFLCSLWLPEAHVEAPTVGSVSALNLLKLGVMFLRFSLTLFPIVSLFSLPLFIYYLFLGIIYASLSAQDKLI
jgi:NADH-quinone oxidoreductase subunit M